MEKGASFKRCLGLFDTRAINGAVNSQPHLTRADEPPQSVAVLILFNPAVVALFYFASNSIGSSNKAKRVEIHLCLLQFYEGVWVSFWVCWF